MCMLCGSLFVLLCFFFCPLCCLFFFDLRILIWYLHTLLMCLIGLRYTLFGMMFSRLSWNYDVIMLTLCKYVVATNGCIFRSYPALHLFPVAIKHRRSVYPVPLWFLYMLWYYGTEYAWNICHGTLTNKQIIPNVPEMISHDGLDFYNSVQQTATTNKFI